MHCLLLKRVKGNFNNLNFRTHTQVRLIDWIQLLEPLHKVPSELFLIVVFTCRWTNYFFHAFLMSEHFVMTTAGC